jgi:adenylate cyclase
MSPKTTNIAIMFADISGSTNLFEVLGDATARVTVSDTLDLLAKVIHVHSGTVIKTIGDEVMCTFPTADDSANAAIEMQETLEDANEMKEPDAPEIKIRVGMHYGPALLEGGDVFGDAVNVAARMAAQAKGGQIITTKSTVDLLAAILRAGTRFVDRAPIKGKKEDIEIFEIIWQEEDVTRMATGMMQDPPKIKQVTLEVSYAGKTVILDQNKQGLVMGRSQACDLPINEKLASRQHVRIEMRRDKFFIIDQSTNGTHVKLDQIDDAFLRREEMHISTNGALSLGKSFLENPTEVVSFILNS